MLEKLTQKELEKKKGEREEEISKRPPNQLDEELDDLRKEQNPDKYKNPEIRKNKKIQPELQN
ncbi:MAG: hypothetical protein PHD51_02720 [Patescibacteria group bacterium]|nr:hypothetical protein [Patescibacteria group bacterium]MDD5490229.1 hypothetical protein [Patescibacteria group bacterium]